MPIRTDRGRAAVYRRIWSWPLRSSRHLAATVAGLAVVAIIVTTVGSALGGTKPHIPAAPTSEAVMPAPSLTTSRPTSPSATPTTAASTPSTSPAFTSTAPGGTTGSASANPAALAVAREFMIRWVAHDGLSSEQWTARLSPYVVTEYVVQLQSVDPARIPARTVTGEPIPTAVTATVVEVDVATDGGIVHLVVLAQRDGTWRVRSYDLAAS